MGTQKMICARRIRVWKRLPFFVGILLFMLLPLFASPAHAVALGVNKASLSFSDVLRGGYAEDVVTVTTDADYPIEAEILLDGNAQGWLNFSDRVFNFSRDHPYELHVIVQPPLDTQIQTYGVNMTIITGSIARGGTSRIGTSTRASFRIPIEIGMTGTEHLACSGGGIEMLDSEKGTPLEFRVTILNRGNVRINPNITLEIYDKFRTTLLETRTLVFGSEILPTTTQTATRSLVVDLDPSQYWAAIKVPLCDYNDLQTFDILSPGDIKDDGEFVRLEAPAWAKTGDILPITAFFRNKGARGVRAIFKGTIARVDNGQIAKVIDTDEYVVGPDATAQLQTFFNPVVGGQYVVTGKVFYNNKLTPERSTIINVNGAPVRSQGGISTVMIILLIVIAILVLLILIQRKRRSLEPPPVHTMHARTGHPPGR
jgi:hypothetical protein